MQTPPRLHARSFGAVLLLLSGGAAQAALSCNGSGSAVGNFTCTQIVTFGPQATDLANAILTFDKWTSSASAGFTQTLLAVDWGIGGSVNSSITVTNNAPTSQSFSLGQIETFNYVAGSGAPVAFLPGGLVGTGNGGTQSFTLAPGASRSYVVSMAAVGGGGSAANLSGFTGPGSFQALASTQSSLSMTGGGGNLMLNMTSNVTAQMTLAYSYRAAAVPEAPSVLLMGAGLAALAALRRTRR